MIFWITCPLNLLPLCLTTLHPFWLPCNSQINYLYLITWFPILWPPNVKIWLTGKDSDSGKDWRQEKKAMTKDETVGWHHRLDEHEFEQALGVGDGRGSLECCSPWGLRVQHDWVNELNWTEELGMKKSCLLVAVFQNNNFKINNLWARNIHKDYRAVNDTFYH